MKIIDNYLIRHGFVKDNAIKKTAGFMELETGAYPDGRPDTDKIYNYDEFIRSYRKLPWLYAGVMALATAITKPSLKVYQQVNKDGEVSQEEVEGEKINDRIEMPSPDLSWRELAQITVINLVLTGNAYWNLVGNRKSNPIVIDQKNPPVEIWWVKPGQIQPKVDAVGAITGYVFTGPTGSEKILDPSEIIHFRLPNPASYYLGMGMMEPATNTAIMELDSVAFQKNFLNNDGTPPFVFTHPGEPTPEARKKFWGAWDERHKGPRKAGRAGMIWGGMDVKPLGTSMKDAQYTELRKMNREEMLASIGVPPSVVGLLEYANYSNMEVQQKKFWEDAAIPIFDLIADKLSLRLAPLFNEDYWFDFDYSKIKVLQEDEERKSRIAQTLIQNGIKSPNEIRSEMYNAEPYEGGDQYFMTAGLQPVSTTPEGKAGAIPGPLAEWTAANPEAAAANTGADPKQAEADKVAADAKAEADRIAAEEAAKAEADKGKSIKDGTSSYWRDPERKKNLHQHFVKRIASREKAMIPLVEKYLKQQAVHVKRKIEKAENMESLRAADLFDIDKEVKIYIEKHLPFYETAFKRAGAAGYNSTKGILAEETKNISADGIKADDFTFTPEQMARLKLQIEQAAGYFNSTTWDSISTLIEEARLNGLTIEELTQELWTNLSDLSVTRARLISRTEMNRTENSGQKEGYKQNEFVNSKGWLCMDLPTSREAHLAADGQEVGLNDDFVVDGQQMEYPGDPRGDAGNVCNCECTTYPVVKEL
jgi:HK97 family phage portal protein